MDRLYIHYGTKVFDRDKFEAIKNPGIHSIVIKPYPGTGFWGSPVDSEYNWKSWCEDSEFRDYDEDNCVKFRIKEPDRIIFINDQESFDWLMQNYLTNIKGIDVYGKHCCKPGLDFEKMLNDGYVAIEVSITNYWRLYNELYGWDCDSIVVFTADAMEFI